MVPRERLRINPSCSQPARQQSAVCLCPLQKLHCAATSVAPAQVAHH